MTDLKRNQAVWMLYQGYWRCFYFKWLSGSTHFFSVARHLPATVSTGRDVCHLSAREGLKAALAQKNTNTQIRYLFEQLILSSRSCSCFPQNLLASRLRTHGASQELVHRVLSGVTLVPEAMTEVIKLSCQQHAA